MIALRYCNMTQNIGRSLDGAAAVELAMALPVLVFLLAGMIDLGLMLAQQNAVGTAADAGAYYALVNADAAVPINSTYQGNIENAVTGSDSVTNGFWGAITASPAPSTFYACPLAGPPPSLTNQGSSTTNCSSGFAPGLYVTVTAQSTYKWLFTRTFSWASATSHTLTATSTVRIQ
jgi:Flp pilus assembly protein TadG